MYGSLGSSVSTNQKLKQVDVATIPSRVGQRVRNEIQFRFNDGENAVGPVYMLETVLNETLTTTLVRSDGLSSSQVYLLTSTFKLVRIADKKVVFEGKSIGRAPFERNASIYSNVRAREDAENRAAKTVATEMAERVATFLSRES
jgi:LPS-assembly lipoprotein